MLQKGIFEFLIISTLGTLPLSINPCRQEKSHGFRWNVHEQTIKTFLSHSVPRICIKYQVKIHKSGDPSSGTFVSWFLLTSYKIGLKGEFSRGASLKKFRNRRGAAIFNNEGSREFEKESTKRPLEGIHPFRRRRSLTFRTSISLHVRIK